MSIQQLFTTLLLIISTTSLSYSQKRINRKKIKFEKKSRIFKKATGWAYNTTSGEWIDYKNVISDNKSYKGKNWILKGSYMKSNHDQNFINMQFKTFSYKNKTYYSLIVKYWGGRYKYPNLKMDWQSLRFMRSYVFSEGEYRKLWEPDTLIMAEVKTTAFIQAGSFGVFNESELLDRIQKALIEELRKEEESDDIKLADYLFPIKKTREGKKQLVRFYLPVIFKNHINFDKRYFEAELKKFKKLLIE